MIGWPGEVEVPTDVILADDQAESAKGRPISQVIFDFGNVLIYWKPEAAMVSRYGPEAIRDMLDNDKSGFFDANNMMDGGAPCAQAQAWVQEHHGAPLG